MDSAKFISVYKDERDYDFVEDLTKGIVPKEGYNLVPIILAPTTAGTGSEITPYSTVWDMDEKKKYSLHLPNLFAELALYDPVLTLSAPKDITVQTSLDTLSHALESIWNKNANEITIYFAVRSAKLVIDNIVRLSNNLENIEYRDMQMKACMYAGLSFSNTQTALAHAMSYYITANKSIAHGIACSFTLPMLIDNIIGEYDFIDQAIIEIFGELSSAPLRMIMSKLNISTNFSDYGIDEHELIELKRSLVNNQRAGNSLAHL